MARSYSKTRSGLLANRRRGAAAIGAVLVTVGLVAAACGSSSSSNTTTTTAAHSSSSGSSSSTVTLTSVSGVGRVLVDSHGRTLYLFTPDKQSASTCSGACAAAWPPLMASGTPTAGSGVDASMLSTVHNSDGTVQVTYNHWPLYTFVGDTAAGQAHGQGLNTFGGHWSALTASGGMATETAAPATTSTKPSAGGYGY